MHSSLYTSALIEAGELHPLLDKPGIKILDASAAMPGEKDPRETYTSEHIPGARFFDIEKISDHNTDLPHMLPSADDFSQAVSALGVVNTDTVIVYGQAGLVMGPARVWWMFRTFGHDNVRVLDGGLPAWKTQGLATDNAAPSAAAARTPFEARMRTDLLRNKDDIQQALTSGGPLILDARPAPRFSGQVAEPRPGLESGHIPGSLNLPCLQLVDPASGKLKSKAELAEIFAPFGITKDRPVITSCGSGVTACVIALALYELGYPFVPVYDGSWSEWGRPENNLPVAKG